MALIICPDCQNSISQYAASCAYCGRPMQPAARPAEQPARPIVEQPAPAFSERPAGAYTERPAGAFEGPAAPYGGRGGYAGQGAYGAQAAYGPQANGYGAPAPYGYGAPAVNPFAKQRSDLQTVYVLYAVGMVVGVLALVALVLSYTRRNEVRGTWLDAHYEWVIDTFWAGLAGGFAGGIAGLLMMLAFFPMGILVLMAVMLFSFGWPIYRLVVGWTAFSEGRIPIGKVSAPRW